MPPEGVSVERDEGIGRESVGGHASVSDSYPPTLTFPPCLLLPTSCSRKGVICEDVDEQRVAECCGEFLDITLPHLSPHLSLPPRIFICGYFDTKNALPFLLTCMSSPDCVSGLWSSSIQPPPGPTVFPDEDTVAVNQPSDLGPNVSVQSSPSSVPSYFRYGSPATRRITSYEHFSGSLPLLWLVRLLMLVSACLLSTFRSLVTVVKVYFSFQVWLLRLRSFPRALFEALHASLRCSEAVFAFPSFIEEDFLGALTAPKSRQIVLDSGCSASTTNDESHFVGPFNKIARTLRVFGWLCRCICRRACSSYYKGGTPSLARYLR